MDAIAEQHPAEAAWRELIATVQAHIDESGAHPSRTLVLLPFAQLMAAARRAWARQARSGFTPRFETLLNWSRQMAFEPADHDVSRDMARDLLTARAWLDRSGLRQHAELLAPRLVEAAWQLAPTAAARTSPARAEWLERARAVLTVGREAPQALQLESAVARIAAEWVAASSHSTDRLLDDKVLAGVELLIVVEGVQADAAGRALAAAVGSRGRVLAWPASVSVGEIRLHCATTASEEAEQAAACVLRHVEAGRSPVAVVANDRVLTRQLLALLARRGMAVRDETGWKLSTTRAAAVLMGALRAHARSATPDEVLDWLKNAPAALAGAVQALEGKLRRQRAREWTSVHVEQDGGGVAQLHERVEASRANFSAARPLSEWLPALRDLLVAWGQWRGLEDDNAGQRLLAALSLAEGTDDELRAHPLASRSMSLGEFTRWASAVLEAGSFVPQRAGDEPVVVLPLSQLLGRPFAAVVIPGCDEASLPASPEPPGAWSAAQRESLELPTRAELATAHCAAWRHALGVPRVDVLWRASDDSGEAVVASPLVQALQLDGAGEPGQEPRALREVPVQPVVSPRAQAPTLLPLKLSASAYHDLRSCPYRFFALRQLGLREAEEIDEDLGKRDFGSWLHAVLAAFHARLEPTSDRESLLDACAEEVVPVPGMHPGEFLPFRAGWPALRDGYLEWLARHERTGASFHGAELDRETALEGVTLVGRLDRLDQTRAGWLVIDYKTESGVSAKARMKQPLEDTQLAFYALLLDEAEVDAMYLSITDRGEVTPVSHPFLREASEQLRAGIEHDVARVRAGQPLAALGEGTACEYCGARGLCRRDFWTR